MTDVMIWAEKPWDGPRKAERERIYTYDRPEQIARCQRCTKPECTDCIGEMSRKCRTKAQTEKTERFLKFYKAGLTDHEIAAAMGLTRPTVSYRRRCYGLPPNPRKPKEEVYHG